MSGYSSEDEKGKVASRRYTRNAWANKHANNPNPPSILQDAREVVRVITQCLDEGVPPPELKGTGPQTPTNKRRRESDEEPVNTGSKQAKVAEKDIIVLSSPKPSEGQPAAPVPVDSGQAKAAQSTTGSSDPKAQEGVTRTPVARSLFTQNP